MTTIAWDGATLAVDRKACLGDTFFEESKLVKIATPEKFIGWIACAGRAEHGYSVARWIAGGKRPEDRPTIEEGEWEAIILTNGRAYCLENGLIPMPAPRRIALGGGKQAAMAVMLMGKSAVEAVGIASLVHVYTGLGVDSVKAGDEAITHTPAE
jgi:hypothetical protein